MKRAVKWLWSQLFRIRSRLLLVNVLIVAVPLLGVGFARFYESEMLHAVEQDMVHQSQVIGQLAGSNFNISNADLRAASHQTTTRLRVVDTRGFIIKDSAGVVDEYVGDRREVIRALSGRYGAATRVIESRGVTVMFTAIPITRERAVVGAVYASRATTSVQVAMHRLRRSIFRILAYAMFVTAVLTLFFAATVSRPLAKLAKRARQLAAGDRTVDLSLDRRDEIGELARALDEMQKELDGRSAEVAELAANISHELKSPLTGMRGAAELLLDGAADDLVTRKRFLNNILSDVDRLDALVSQILELSRVRSDSERFETVKVGDIVGRAISSATEAVGEGAHVRLDSSSNDASVNARPSHLTAAIRNLIENALAHAEPDTDVDVRVVVGRRQIQIEVENYGPMIPVEVRERIWGRFYTTRGETGGTGLGLPIVRAVARAHGGEAELKSSTNQSTVFALSIPRA